MNGYYAGLYSGTFNPYYFNSYDSYSYYYGPHSHDGVIVASNSPRGGHAISELYGRSITSTTSHNPRVIPSADGETAIGRPKRDVSSSLTKG